LLLTCIVFWVSSEELVIPRSRKHLVRYKCFLNISLHLSKRSQAGITSG